MKMTPATPDPQKFFRGSYAVSILEFGVSRPYIVEMRAKKPLESLK